MKRPSIRAILEVLSSSRLEEIARRSGLPLTENAAPAQVLELCVNLPRQELRALLAELRVLELRELSKLLAQKPRGRTKEELLDGLVGPTHGYLSLVPDGLITSPAEQTPGLADEALRAANSPATPPKTNPSPSPKPTPKPIPKAAKGKGEGRRALGFEAKLWQAADKLRNNMDAAEYKHVVLGLIFLKYISDAFEAARGPEGEDPPEGSTFWVPVTARWTTLAGHAHTPRIGSMVDAAMAAIERSNPGLHGVLPRHYDRPDLDKERLGELVELVGTIGLGSHEDRSRDILGRVYEYFLTSFATAEGKNGGQFYTPRCVVELLVAMLAPYKGTVYDPACGSGGMFVQSERFIEEHGGRLGDIAIHGQESNPTTWRLAKMNLAIRGIPCDLGPEHGDSFTRELHAELKADYVLANPPFNAREWGRERLLRDPRWAYGLPPESNANFAWVQHFIHHLGPHGLAGFVLANGAMSSASAGEGEIRRAIVEDDLVDCMVALPPKLFYSTQIPVSLWFLARDKTDARFRKRSGETLFIDARELGSMVDRIHRELTDDDVDRIVRTYHSWRGDPDTPAYHDVPGFCRSVGLDELRSNGCTLVPGHYLGPSPGTCEPVGADFRERFAPIAHEIGAHLDRAAELEKKIRALLRRLGQ